MGNPLTKCCRCLFSKHYPTTGTIDFNPDNVKIPTKSYFSATEERALRSKYKNPFPFKSNPPTIWKTGQIIGQGSFGCVILVANPQTGELMAMKELYLDNRSDISLHNSITEIEKEVQILSSLNHPNIVRYLGTRKSKKSLKIFMEYVSGGSISNFISKYGKISESLMKIYSKQILEGLEYLHFNKIAHRDIKGANVLVCVDGNCKLTDFGSAKKKFGDFSDMKSFIGTINYMAPEVMKQQSYGRLADIWSFGCLMIEMVTGKPPWHQFKNPISLLMHVCSNNIMPDLPEYVSDVCKDFILSCFERDLSKRPNVCKLIKHSFLRKVPNLEKNKKNSVSTSVIPKVGLASGVRISGKNTKNALLTHRNLKNSCMNGFTGQVIFEMAKELSEDIEELDAKFSVSPPFGIRAKRSSECLDRESEGIVMIRKSSFCCCNEDVKDIMEINEIPVKCDYFGYKSKKFNVNSDEDSEPFGHKSGRFSEESDEGIDTYRKSSIYGSEENSKFIVPSKVIVTRNDHRTTQETEEDGEILFSNRI